MADKIVVMHDGRVEQIGAPLELYDTPANLFVGGFIGSPAMNMLAGRVDRDDGRFVTGDGIALPLDRPLGAAPGMAIYGLRPESMRLGGDIPLTVEVVEPTGSETHVVGRLGETAVVGVFRERIAAGPGERIGIAVEAAATHVFDAESGDRITA
jgi:multiple sugar transport system ATP-binding protein